MNCLQLNLDEVHCIVPIAVMDQRGRWMDGKAVETSRKGAKAVDVQQKSCAMAAKSSKAAADKTANAAENQQKSS